MAFIAVGEDDAGNRVTLGVVRAQADRRQRPRGVRSARAFGPEGTWRIAFISAAVAAVHARLADQIEDGGSSSLTVPSAKRIRPRGISGSAHAGLQRFLAPPVILLTLRNEHGDDMHDLFNDYSGSNPICHTL